ncbi:MAG: helix-turn-helix transcriptional regulator [Pirellulales bacterium]|nr:helix-turn-helix transcriptional regulator [Pirellulales bacterium]
MMATYAISLRLGRIMPQFGLHLRTLRLQAGLGLRKFAGLLNERPSTVSAVEQGHRLPWKSCQKLQKVADVLGIAANSPQFEELINLAKVACEVPLGGPQQHPHVAPLVVTTSAKIQLTEESLQETLRHCNAGYSPPGS